MKKTSTIVIFFVLLTLLFGYFSYKRHFYYFGNTGKCITLWKRVGGKCYIIPNKFYGFSEPDNFVELSNLSNITFYWSKELPEKFIVRNEGYEFNIISKKEKNNIFLKYDDNKEYYRSLLYLKEAKEHNDVKSNTEILNISIREPYATDKKGKKL